MMRKTTINTGFVTNANPRRPIPIKILLHFNSVTLLSLSASRPLNGLQQRDVIENSPTITPAVAIEIPMLTRYFDKIVTTI